MPGFTPDEGETLVANLIFPQADVDRGIDSELLLFTNADPDNSITAAALTEPTGTDYARITLSDASWTVTDSTAGYAVQTFTVGAGGWTGDVYGYAIVTTGITPRILTIEVDPKGPYTFYANDTYEVTPSITVS